MKLFLALNTDTKRDFVSVQTLRVGWEQLLTSVARNINEVENQVCRSSGYQMAHNVASYYNKRVLLVDISSHVIRCIVIYTCMLANL